MGDDVLMYMGTVLGGTSLDRVKRHPTIDDGVVIGAGSIGLTEKRLFSLDKRFFLKEFTIVPMRFSFRPICKASDWAFQAEQIMDRRHPQAWNFAWHRRLK